MSVNLLDLVKQSAGGDFAGMAAKFLGESEGATSSALSALLPAVLGGMAQKASSLDGAKSLLSLVGGSNVDTGILGNLGAVFGGGGAKANSLMGVGSTLLSSLFGNKVGGLASALASMAGIKSSAATSLMSLAAPVAFSAIKKYVVDNKLDASALMNLFGGQAKSLQGAVDSRLAGVLGLGAPAAESVKKAAYVEPVREPKRSFNWWPWILAALAAILFFSWFRSGKEPEKVVTAPAPAAKPAQAPATAVAATPYPAKVFFDVGQVTINEGSKKTLLDFAQIIKGNQDVVEITGYTDQTGDPEKNQEIAKERAKAVRDALVAAGVPESRMTLKPPSSVMSGAGSDADARRVEITKAAK
jgi:outer membrane protein OmpA-like peptidoglycan-associated protein